MKNKVLSISNIGKYYINEKSNINVIDNISFDLNEREIISIVGTSGCGKSTLLNIISGLLKPDKGFINYNINSKRDIGYMLQNDALFPWLNIIENSKLISDIKKINNDEYINFLLDRYGLSEFKKKYPKELSGGMRQRVSLIRTVAANPKLLLLDEPFASLDYQSRLSIGNDVYNLIKEKRLSSIIVTHDIAEAISLSDKVIVLSKRPCKIKNIYRLDFDNNLTPIERRKNNKFLEYHDLICKDLDLFDK